LFSPFSLLFFLPLDGHKRQDKTYAANGKGLLSCPPCFLGWVFCPLSQREREQSTRIKVVPEKTYPCKLPPLAGDSWDGGGRSSGVLLIQLLAGLEATDDLILIGVDVFANKDRLGGKLTCECRG
jgi:hypothetical protein